MKIQAHVDRCSMCRAEFNLLERFEPAVMAAAGGAVAAPGSARDEAMEAGPLEWLRGGLSRWIEELELRRSLVFATAAGIAILIAAACQRKPPAGPVVFTDEEMRQIDLPTLIVWGAGDKVFSPDNAARLDADIQQTEVHIVEGSGHLPQIEQTEAFLEAVIPFLNSAGTN